MASFSSDAPDFCFGYVCLESRGRISEIQVTLLPGIDEGKRSRDKRVLLKCLLIVNSKFLKISISYRGAILWNAVSSYFTGQFTDFYPKVRKDPYFKELDFSVQSAQSLPRHYQDFKCF